MPVTAEELEAARAELARMEQRYHQEQTTTIRLRRSPDGYRGDLSCIDFADRVEIGPADGDGAPNRHAVRKNGVQVGTLVEWYGNNGRGKLAASKFEPAPGVTVKWL